MIGEVKSNQVGSESAVSNVM